MYFCLFPAPHPSCVDFKNEYILRYDRSCLFGIGVNEFTGGQQDGDGLHGNYMFILISEGGFLCCSQFYHEQESESENAQETEDFAGNYQFRSGLNRRMREIR